jgi:hypothetical protein
MRRFSRLLFGIFVLTFATGCQTVGYKPTGETHQWIAYRIDLGESVLEFSLPPGESRQFPAFPIREHVDINRSDLYDDALIGPRLLDRTWDYAPGPLSMVEGTLRAFILLRRSEQALDSMEALKSAIEENSKLEDAARYLESGRRLPSTLPTQFAMSSVGGQEALKLRAGVPAPVFAVAVGRHAYIELYVQVSDFHKRPDWRKDAEAAHDAIFRSIRITRR